MDSKWKVSLVLAAAAIFASVTVAQAQPSEEVRKERKELRKQERELHKQERQLRKEEMQERIEMMIMWKLTEELDLNQDMANKVFPVVNEHGKNQRELRKKRSETIQQIKQELDKELTDSATLRKLIDDFKKNERDMVEDRINRLDELSKVLNDEQVAKLIILVPKIERRVKEAIHEARKIHRQQKKDRPNPEGNEQAAEIGPAF